MSREKERILELLEKGKITSDEALKLLDAIGASGSKESKETIGNSISEMIKNSISFALKKTGEVIDVATNSGDKNMYKQEVEQPEDFQILEINLAAGDITYLGFLMLQRDLGSAAIMFSIFIAYLYAFEKNRWHYRASLIAFALFAIMGYFILPHVQVRFAVWLHPFKFYEQRGYQIVTALTAIANGSWFGTGIGLGIPYIIPVSISDMILAAIMEEMGIFMGIAIILIYLVFSIDALNVSRRVRDPFYKKTSVLICSLFMIQFMVILMGTLNIVPLTGVTAPFISYGGSSMVSSFLLLGILQGSLRMVSHES